MRSPSSLPSGTVTLLFTDIEGSAEKWDHLPEAMAVALARHNEILRAAINDHAGVVVKEKGDGFFAAFVSPVDAVEAVIEAQQLIEAEDWAAELGSLRVRMALHSGTLEPAADDYHGPEVNKVARLEGVAHGGQVLLSSSTASLLAGELPAGVGLVNLGSHRLRSLARPDHIFQLMAPGLESAFAPLRTEAFDRRVLPVYRTSFVGREREVVEILDLLERSDCRVLTLVGPGGIGKTRLAVEAVRCAATQRSHGAAFIPLATVRNPVGVASAIAGALEFSFDLHGLAMVDPKTQLIDYLATQDLILVLDNFEHLMAASPFIAELTQRTASVDVVVTSRQRLEISGEWALEIGGLELDTSDDGQATAVQLFVERACQARSGFAVLDEDLTDIRRICVQVQAMPLGIELAAPWVTVLSCAEIAREIERSIDFLESTGGETDRRHHSLRAVFESSWSLLQDQQRTAFQRLSVFPAAFSRDAAEEIASASIRTLMELRSRSLLQQTPEGDLQLHPLLRQFGLESLQSGESDVLYARHAQFYLGRLLIRETDLRGGWRQLDAASELAAEHENLRQAVEWAVGHLPSEETCAILGALHQFYLNHGWHEGREEFLRLVTLSQDAPEAHGGSRPAGATCLWAAAYLSVYLAALAEVDEGEALVERVLPAWEERGGIGLAMCRYSAGVLAVERGDYPRAEEHLALALDLAHRSGDAVLIGTTLLWYGWVVAEQGDVEEGKRLFDECLAVMSNPTNHWGRAFTLSKLGVAADGMGNHERAAEYHNESREMFVKTNDVAGQAYTLSRLSLTYWLMGDYHQSRDHGLEGLALFERLNHRWGVSASLCRIGFAELGLGQKTSAARRFLAALDGAEGSGLLALVLYALVGAGALLADLGEDERATEILSYVIDQPGLPSQYRDLANLSLAALRNRVDSSRFDTAVAQGRHADLIGMTSAARAAVSRAGR